MLLGLVGVGSGEWGGKMVGIGGRWLVLERGEVRMVVVMVL